MIRERIGFFLRTFLNGFDYENRGEDFMVVYWNGPAV